MTAVLLCAHGSSVSAEACAPALALVAALRAQGRFSQVRAAFWKQAPSLRHVLLGITDPEVVVVPLFFAQGYFTRRVLPREVVSDRHHLRWCEPVGTDPSLQSVILTRAREAAPGVDPAQASLVLVGHGSARSKASRQSVLDHAEAVRGLGRFAEVMTVFTDDDPLVATCLAQAQAPHLIVVPVMSADGYHARQTIPEDLGLAQDPGPGPHPLPAGRSLYLSRAVGTSATMLEVVLARLTQALGGLPALHSVCPVALRTPTAWLSTPQGRWGQVSWRAMPDDIVELRHEGDRDRPESALEDVGSVEALARLALYAVDGSFRSLSWAPTLRQGWRLELRGQVQAARALEAVYPEALAMEDHAPSSWEDWAARQSGILAPLAALTQAQRAQVQAQCCGASSCLASRRWGQGAAPWQAPGACLAPCPTWSKVASQLLP